MSRIVIRSVKKQIKQHSESPSSSLLYKLAYLYNSSDWATSKYFWNHRPEELLARDSPNLEDLMSLVDLHVDSGWSSLNIHEFGEGVLLKGPPHLWHFSAKDVQRFRNLILLVLACSMGYKACKFHARLVGLIKPGDAIISFNYDTLLDDALTEAGKMSVNGYGVNFSGIYGALDHVVSSHLGESSAVELYKLHGSMNWLHCPACESTFLDTAAGGVTVMERLRRAYESHLKYLARAYAGDLTADWLLDIGESDVAECHFCRSYLARPIIPPIHNKSFSRHPFLLPWYRAAMSLASAENIIIIGYSLPPNDFYSRLLFAFSGDDVRSVVVVNPEPTIAEKFRDALRMRRLPEVMTPDGFLQANGV